MAAVIGAAAAAGFGAERRFGPGAVRAARGLMGFLLWVVVPLVAFFNIASLEFTVQVGVGILFAYTALAVTVALAFALGTWVLRLERSSVGALMLVAGLANTGFLGLPFALALFGREALPSAVAYDVLVSAVALVTIGFSIGAAFGTLAERPARRLRTFFTRNPPLYATVAGFVAPAALAPGWAVGATQVLVLATVPLGFFAVGVTLSSERREREGRAAGSGPAVATGVALKLIVAPGVVLGLSAALVEVPEVYLSQAAMASAVNAIVVANAYGLDRQLTAAAIAWSTAAVVSAGIVVSLVA